MKLKNQLTALLILLTLTFALPIETMAQNHRHGPPSWAPAHGYRAKTRHVYFPEYNVYYDVQRSSYIYLNGANWVVSIDLPFRLARLDFGRAAIVEMEIYTDHPYRYNREHRVLYCNHVRHFDRNDHNREYAYYHKHSKDYGHNDRDRRYDRNDHDRRYERNDNNRYDRHDNDHGDRDRNYERRDNDRNDHGKTYSNNNNSHNKGNKEYSKASNGNKGNGNHSKGNNGKGNGKGGRVYNQHRK